MMLPAKNLEKYQSILCLHGDLPDAAFFRAINLPVIAADGAANKLIALGVNPCMIIGDLDSVHPEILTQYPFMHVPDQNTNDYQKALHYLAMEGLLPAIVVGIHGGFVDHILNNIQLFMESDNLLYAPPVWGLVLRDNKKMCWPMALETKISIMGIPEAIVSSQGLKWELDKTKLAFPGVTSCFNRSVLPEVELMVHTGAALILTYEEQVVDAALIDH